MLPVAGELYRSALDEDPQYAPAWAKLGRVYRVLAKYGGEDATENLQAGATMRFSGRCRSIPI